MNVVDHKFFRELEQLPFIDEIWLYGSRARGDATERSDIDLAILCPKASKNNWSEVCRIIEDADTLLKIDYVRFDELSAGDKLVNNILRFKKVLYRKDSDFMEKEFWKDYFESLGDAIDRLEEIIKHPDISTIDYLQDAAIQRFEFCIELFWKVLKKFLAYEKVDATTPRDVLQKSYQFKLIDDEQTWISMLDDRNKTSHMYKQELANEVFEHIKEYFPVLKRTYENLKARFYE